MTQSAGTAKYTDCISEEGLDSPKECPGYESTQTDGEVPVMLDLRGMQSIPFITIAPRSTLARSGST